MRQIHKKPALTRPCYSRQTSENITLSKGVLEQTLDEQEEEEEEQTLFGDLHPRSKAHGQGQKSKTQHCHFSWKLNRLTTLTQIGRMVLCDKVVQNIFCTVTSTHGQGYV